MSTKRDGPKSYADDVGRVMHQELWMKTDKKLNFNADKGLNETTCLNQSQPFRN